MIQYWAKLTEQEDWRIAKVTPIFKKDSRGDIGNYRPVSLTFLGKLVETVIKKMFAKQMDEQDFLGFSIIVLQEHQQECGSGQSN